ncbi:hypothetical protein [Rhodococcus sp. UNC363MFTsu5.1]|uniref:hypothetical protein n=1 Tax=Rhodococcus sp. UNC363MFTsu5.1 TaxID=1449069 RepID=UPI00048633E6|nr:hypothetical protein [Rhodococcus sp. UNC363MFTsu5.1]
MVEHLPPGSALHRVQNEGHQWTNVEALLWSIAHKLDWLDQRIVWSRRVKPKWPKWRVFPWTRDAVKIGDLGEATPEQALAYLKSQSPPKVVSDVG